MKQKEMWTIIGISALTSVIVFFVLAQAFGQPLFGPPSTTNAKIVNANQCNADGTCEMESAKVTGDIFGKKINVAEVKTGDLISTSALFLENSGNDSSGSTTIVGGEVRTQDLVATDQVKGYALVGTYGVSGGWIQANSPEGFSSLYPDRIESTSLARKNSSGPANAYVCANKIGVLYRSNSACT